MLFEEPFLKKVFLKLLPKTLSYRAWGGGQLESIVQ
jgi:hypothetical protein